MLAKLWKKILLAVCIVACLFNITHKLVNRHSLKENLQSVNDGETIFDLSRDKSSSGANSETKSVTSSDGSSSEASSNENSEGSNGTGEHKNKGYYDEDGNYRLYEDDEKNEEANANGNESENDDEEGSNEEESNNGNDGNDENGENSGGDFNVKDTVSKAKDKLKNVDIDVEPAEATEVYEDIPVYDENDPQRNAGNNEDYVYTWRDFFDIFKSN